MQWLQDSDVSVFRFINGKLANSIFDQVMPFLSGNVCFYPALIVLAGFVIWKYRARGILFLLLLALAVGLTDGAVCRTIKHAVGRDRPFAALPDVRCLLGQGGSGSMPSSHAANWFAATMVAFVFYRRSLWIMLPLAAAVSFSRVYCGVHYPSDVIAGAILGAGTAAATLWLCTELWIFVGRRWFPLWWEKFPLLLAPPQRAESEAEEIEEPQFAPRLKPGRQPAPGTFAPRHITVDQHWLRLGYLLISIFLVARLLYVASDVIQLSPEEAAHWMRSRQLAGIQLSDSPLAFILVWVGTLLFSDTPFGVRAFAPVLSAGLSVMLFRLFSRATNARAGFFTLLFLNSSPMLAAGGVLLQGDFLRAFFWAACLVCGWRALQTERSTGWWSLTGLSAALVSLSQFATLFPLAALLFLFVLSMPARRQLRKAGPWLGLIIYLGVFALEIFWPEHSKIHSIPPWLESRSWSVNARSLLLLNPFWFAFGFWAAGAFWRRNRHNPFLVYCFCMSVPALVFALIFDPGWACIAAPGIGLVCLMTAYWDIQWRLQSAQLKPWLSLGLIVGLAATLLGHETNWVEKLSGRYLPARFDPLAPVRGWRETAILADNMRAEAVKAGKPVFIIASTLGLAGQLSFYLPEARASARQNPFVYVYADRRDVESPYADRKGEDALFVIQQTEESEPASVTQARLQPRFDSITDLGVKEIKHHGQVLRRFQFFACRNLQ